MKRAWVEGIIGLLFLVAAGVAVYLYGERSAALESLAGARLEVDRLSASLQSSEDAQAALQQQMAERDMLSERERQELARMDGEAKRSQELLGSLMEENNELRNQIEIAETQIKDLQERLAVRSDQVSELRASLSDCGARTQGIENQLFEAKQDIENLREKTSGLVEQNDIFQSNLNELKTENEALSTVSRDCGETNRSLEERLSGLTLTLGRRDAQIERMDRESGALKKHAAEVDALLAEKSQELARADARLGELENDRSALKQRINAVNSSFQLLKRGFLDAASEGSELQAALSACRAEARSAAEELKAAAEKATESAGLAETAQATLQQSRQQREQAEARADALEKALADRNAAIGALDERLARLSEEKGEASVAIARLKDTYEELRTEFKQELASRETTIGRLREQLSVTLLDDILFDLARVTISAKGKKTLGRLGEVLKKNDLVEIVVAGHTDDVPIAADFRSHYPSNWELSAARAAAVVRFFQDRHGIDPSRMTVQGFSYYRPAAPNDTPDNRAANRRVEIFIRARH